MSALSRAIEGCLRMILLCVTNSRDSTQQAKKQSKSSVEGLVDTIANLQPLDMAVDFCALHVPEHTCFCTTGGHGVGDPGPKFRAPGLKPRAVHSVHADF